MKAFALNSIACHYFLVALLSVYKWCDLQDGGWVRFFQCCLFICFSLQRPTYSVRTMQVSDRLYHGSFGPTRWPTNLGLFLVALSRISRSPQCWLCVSLCLRSVHCVGSSQKCSPLVFFSAAGLTLSHYQPCTTYSNDAPVQGTVLGSGGYRLFGNRAADGI